jgi:hypothetical protein
MTNIKEEHNVKSIRKDMVSNRSSDMKGERFVLSEKIEDLFEVEYLDSMADVQGDVSKILKEFIRLLKEEIDKKITTDTHGVAHSRCEGLWLAKDIIKNSAGDKLCQ